MLTDFANTVASTIGRITFRDALLYRSTPVDNGKGTLTRNPEPVPVQVQIDALTQVQRAEGWAEDDVRLLILSDGLAKWLENGRVQDDDIVQVIGGDTYAISAPALDPALSHYSCRGRIKPGWRPPQ